MYLSIVIPSFNEEHNIPLLFAQIKSVVSDLDYECIFVDDGSKDKTFENIKKLASENERVKGISFSRNFGHQIALLAGLKKAKGEITIMMDADGQHPPQVIPLLIEQYKLGSDIVNTKRKSTADTGVLKDLSSKWYYKLINLLTDVKIESASSDFRLMNRSAVEAFLSLPEKDRFTRGLVSWMGFDQSIIEFDAPARMTGNSKYTLKRMIHFAWDGITSFSVKPLLLSLYVGVFSLLFGILYSLYAVIAFFIGKTIPGWTSLMIVILLIGGIQLLSIGIIGQYLSRIFTESKNRPHYFVKDIC